MATSPFESAALVAAVRRDMAELAAAEFHWEGLDPIALQRVIADFIDDDHRFRASPPAEVAGLISVVEGHPGWVEPEIRTRFIEVRDSVLGVPGRLPMCSTAVPRTSTGSFVRPKAREDRQSSSNRGDRPCRRAPTHIGPNRCD